MAIPFALALPAIAGYITTFFTATVSFLSLWLTKRVALVTAGVAVLVTLTTAFVAAITASISAISYALPSELSTAASWVWPDNASACIAAIIAAHALRWTYDWNVTITKSKFLGI